jgi:hypothetical protein
LSGHPSVPRRCWRSGLCAFATLVGPSYGALPFHEQDPRDTDHLVAPLFSRFLSDVKSVSKKCLLHMYFTYRVLASSILQGRPIFWTHK